MFDILHRFHIGNYYFDERNREVILLGYSKESMTRTKNLLKDYIEGLVLNTLYVDTKAEIVEFIEKLYAHSLVFAQGYKNDITYNKTFRTNTSYQNLKHYKETKKETENISLWFVKNKMLGIRMVEYLNEKEFYEEVNRIADYVLTSVNERDKEEWLETIYYRFFLDVQVLSVDGLYRGVYYEPDTRTFYRFTDSANKKFYRLNTCKEDGYTGIFKELKNLNKIEENKFKYYKDFDKLYLVNRR